MKTWNLSQIMFIKIHNNTVQSQNKAGSYWRKTMPDPTPAQLIKVQKVGSSYGTWHACCWLADRDGRWKWKLMLSRIFKGNLYSYYFSNNIFNSHVLFHVQNVTFPILTPHMIEVSCACCHGSKVVSTCYQFLATSPCFCACELFVSCWLASGLMFLHCSSSRCVNSAFIFSFLGDVRWREVVDNPSS